MPSLCAGGVYSVSEVEPGIDESSIEIEDQEGHSTYDALRDRRTLFFATARAAGLRWGCLPSI